MSGELKLRVGRFGRGFFQSENVDREMTWSAAYNRTGSWYDLVGKWFKNPTQWDFTEQRKPIQPTHIELPADKKAYIVT